jgi:hypothetical protein
MFSAQPCGFDRSVWNLHNFISIPYFGLLWLLVVGHFKAFTDVLREIRRSVTRKVWKVVESLNR